MYVYIRPSFFVRHLTYICAWYYNNRGPITLVCLFLYFREISVRFVFTRWRLLHDLTTRTHSSGSLPVLWTPTPIQQHSLTAGNMSDKDTVTEEPEVFRSPLGGNKVLIDVMCWYRSILCLMMIRFSYIACSITRWMESLQVLTGSHEIP